MPRHFRPLNFVVLLTLFGSSFAHGGTFSFLHACTGLISGLNRRNVSIASEIPDFPVVKNLISPRDLTRQGFTKIQFIPGKGFERLHMAKGGIDGFHDDYTSLGALAEITYRPVHSQKVFKYEGVVIREQSSGYEILDGDGKVHILNNNLGHFEEVWLKSGPVRWRLVDLKKLTLPPTPNHKISYVIFKVRGQDGKKHVLSGYLNTIQIADGYNIIVVTSEMGGTHYIDPRMIADDIIDAMVAPARDVNAAIKVNPKLYQAKSDQMIDVLPEFAKDSARSFQ